MMLPPSTRLQAGQASIEYLLVCLALVAVLLAGDPSPLDRLLELIQHAYDRFAYGISLP